MIVSIDRPSRPQADLADLTTKQILRRGYERQADGEERFVVQFSTNLTMLEEAAVRRRLNTSNDVEEQLQARLLGAVADMKTYEGLTNTSTATNTAILKLLCKVVRALIRLQLRQLDAVD